MNIILETTTGRLVPPGTVPQLARGPDPATLQFVTNSVAALLPGGHPVSLALFTPDDMVTPKATFAVWTANPTWVQYQANLDSLQTNLAWTSQTTLLGRISYSTPNVDSQLFHVSLSGAPNGSSTATQVIISQPSGPVNYVQEIGSFGGQVALAQTEGYLRAKAAGTLLGLQLAAQVAPTGADILVEVYKGGVATGKVGKLTAAAKSEETVFGAPLALAIGDVIQFRCTQIGSATKGSNLSVKGIVQLQ
ncbi:MAG: hypothetical protein V4773_04260 [Verrucomicrobiota bacterium]